jgi:hypothetical protein
MKVIRRMKAALIGLGLVVFLASGLLIYRIAQLPLQPAHVALARVIAVELSSGGGRSPNTYIVVRNARGTGQFVLLQSEVRCEVSQDVMVQQRGITLTPLPTTCK